MDHSNPHVKNMKETIIHHLWQNDIVSIQPSTLHLHQLFPSAPPFPLSIRFDGFDGWLHRLLTLNRRASIQHRDEGETIIIHDAMGALDGFCKMATATESTSKGQVILSEIFLTHPTTVDASIEEQTRSLQILEIPANTFLVTPLIDCEFSGSSTTTLDLCRQSPFMTLSEFLSLSVSGGYITRRQFIEIRHELLDLDRYLAEFGTPVAA